MTLTFEVDELDAASIHQAIARWQREVGDVADGESSLGGAVLGEICRSWMEYHESWQPPADSEGEEWK